MNIYIYFLLFSDIMGERLALEERRVVASLMEVFRSPTIDRRKFQDQF
jgi:hypothetical protein